MSDARWLYHLLLRSDLGRGGLDAYAPESLAAEGFIHASYQPAVAASAALYFAEGAPLVVMRIDPRVLAQHGIAIDVAATPRGPMPHILAALPRRAITQVSSLGDVAHAPDAIRDMLDA